MQETELILLNSDLLLHEKEFLEFRNFMQNPDNQSKLDSEHYIDYSNEENCIKIIPIMSEEMEREIQKVPLHRSELYEKSRINMIIYSGYILLTIRTLRKLFSL